MNAELLKPALYSLAGTPGLPDCPALRGGRCRCGYVFFPMQTYGCERCGRFGESLQPLLLAGRGCLIASAVVHIHSPERPTPFTVGSIALDDGPVVRTLLAKTQNQLAPGTVMMSTLVAVPPGEDGAARVDLRFMPAA